MIHSASMDSNIVFYNIYSNLGICGKPHRQSGRNDGVYGGPGAVMSATFLQKFPRARVFEFRFTQNDVVAGKECFSTMAQESERCKEELVSHLAPADMLVAIGGDNSITLPALLADIERFGVDAVGVITFDTHGDIHLAATTPSGNFHGVYMRLFFDAFDVPEIDRLAPQKLEGSDIIYFGNFDFEQEEIDFMEEKKIRRYDRDHIRNNFEEVVASLQRFLDSHAHVHINFDIDVFDESLVKATGITNKNGLTREDVFPLLAHIAQHPSKTLSLSEVNPEKSGAHETVRLAQEVIEALAP